VRRLAFLALAIAGASPAVAETLEVQVNRAIDRGVKAARGLLGPDGAGRTHYHGNYAEGDTALVLCTLVKSGVLADDPQVKKCLAWLLPRVPQKTYSAAALVLALDAFKDKQFDEKIQATAKGIEDSLDPHVRRWGYPDERTDLSNTQYAALALWTAERHGFKAREDTWAALLQGVAEMRAIDDGFKYRPDSRTTGAMTVAGLTALELALPRSPSGQLPARFADIRQRAKTALDKAWEYLERRFTVTGNPLGAHSHHEDWLLYYLYGVERLCAITGRDKIGDHDWYAEGARQLVSMQEDDGSWGDPANTCFALLFLRRATFTAMGRELKPLEGEGVVLATKPKPPRGDVPFVRRWLLLGPLEDPDDDLLDKSFFEESRARPAAQSYSGPHRWIPFRSLQDRIELGGPAGPKNEAVTCAFVYVHAGVETDAVLWFGHDDGARMWLDGTLVHDRHFDNAYAEDRFAVPVHLTPGPHRLLMKVRNIGGGHSLRLRIAKPDGTPATAVRTSLEENDLEIEQAALAHPGGVPLDDLLCLLPRETRLRWTFESPDQIERFAFDREYGPYPLWDDDPSQRKDGHLPNPGATGVFALHAADGNTPSTAYLKLRVPERALSVRMRVSATTASSPGKADAVLRVGVFDGAMRWLRSVEVGPDAAPDAANWTWVEFDLGGCEGKEVLLAVQAVNGGKHGWHWEGVWIDEMEVKCGS
jgi:hypothetical protein